MRAVDIIRAKRDGAELDAATIEAFVRGATAGEIPDYQVTAFLMAVFFRGMTAAETGAMTRAMRDSGDVVVFDPALPTVDKHSTGGVGDKVSISLAPLVAACGARVPMISGRGLGHTGGTLDKLEAIPGFNVRLDLDRFRDMVERLGTSMIGQTERICPADRLFYSLRDVTSTVESLPLIVSSILSKKSAEGARSLVMDVKCGSGAFMEGEADAGRLAEALVETGRAMGLRVRALVTDMNQPLGRTVGNALETVEALDFLRGDAQADYAELTYTLAAHMLALSGVAPDLENARARAEAVVADGRALAVMRALVREHGGDPRAVDDPSLLPQAPRIEEFKAERSGCICAIDTRRVGVAAMMLGAGRRKASDAVDPAVGFVIRKRLGDRVDAGEPILSAHIRDKATWAAARVELSAAYRIGDDVPIVGPLVKRVYADG